MKSGARFGAACLAVFLLAQGFARAGAQDAAAQAARLDKYESAASESVEVTLDGPLLRLAAAVMSDKEPEQRKVKELLRDVQGIYVRVFEFEKEGAYDPAEVGALRGAYQGGGWSRVADVKSGRYENAEVYVSTDGEVIRGLAVVASGARELVFVSISGSIRPERISDLEGNFSIPRMRLSVNAKE